MPLERDTGEVCDGALLRSLGNTPLLQTLMSASRLLAKRWLTLAEELKTLVAMLERLTTQHAKRLRARFGVGLQTAAVVVAVAGANPDGLKSEPRQGPYAGQVPCMLRLAK